MGEVGGYDMHLYCDTPTCNNARAKRGEAPGQYFGINKREAWADATKEGWHRHRDPHGGWLYFCGACKKSPLFREPAAPKETA